MKKDNIIKIVCVLIIIASATFISSRVMGVGLGSNIDMGGNKIVNLGSPTADDEAVNRGYLNTAIRGGGSINYLPKWDSSYALVNSHISDDGTKLNFNQTETQNFIIQKVTNQATMSPAPAVGQIWMCVDADMKCDG